MRKSIAYFHRTNNHNNRYKNRHAEIESDNNFHNPWWQPIKKYRSICNTNREHYDYCNN